MVNKVTLVGRLGRDPETRYTGGGQAVSNFSIATDETWKDKNGEKQKRTEWHRIVAWGKLAEIVQQYVKKGGLVYVEGRIQSRKWKDKEDVERTSFEIVISVLRMLGGGDRTSKPAQNTDLGEPDGTGDYQEPRSTNGSTGDISDEDIPF